MIADNSPETDFDGDDVVVVASGSAAEGSRRAVMLPRSARRLDLEQMSAVRAMQLVGMQLARLEDELGGLVDGARDLGISWSLIGWCSHMTGEGARRRWDLDVA
jgi:hypothetical protein